MAKKGVVIFDGEDKFVAKKKHVYSKSKGQAKHAKEVFLGVRAEMDAGETPAEPVQSISEQGLSQGITPTPINDAGIVSAGPSQPIISTPIGNIPSLPQVSIPPIIAPSVEDRKSIMPVYEKPVSVAPTPELPTWSTGTVLTTTTQPFFGDEGNEKLLRYPGGKVVDPRLPATPPFDDRLPGDGKPKGVPVEVWNPSNNPEPTIPKSPTSCGENQYFDPIYNKCIDKPLNCEPPNLIIGGKCVAPYNPTPTTSSTTSTTTKAVDTTPTTSTTTSTTTKAIVTTPTTSTTTSTTTLTTTTAPSKGNCQPPIYAAPKYYKWVDKGDCKWELQVDQVALPNAAPAPVLPIVTLPIVSTTNAPSTTTSTIQTTTTKSPLGTLPGSGGGGASGGGGGGGEDTAPTQEAPKKNYFWWYVGGALAIYLILKKKKN